MLQDQVVLSLRYLEGQFQIPGLEAAFKDQGAVVQGGGVIGPGGGVAVDWPGKTVEVAEDFVEVQQVRPEHLEVLRIPAVYYRGRTEFRLLGFHLVVYCTHR